MMDGFFARASALLAAALLAGCDSPSGAVDAADLRAAVVAGDDQNGAAGQPLPDTVVVRVTDDAGRPVAGLTVDWTVVTANGGQPQAAAVATDAEGRARNRWMAGTAAGEHWMELRATLRGQTVVLDSIRAVIGPGPAAEAAVAGDTVRSLLPGQTSRVLLAGRDAYGNPIAAGEVQAAWSTSAPGVATVAADGTVTAVSPGRAVVTARVGSTDHRVHVTVRGMVQAARPVTGHVVDLHGGAGRLIAAGTGDTPRLWELTGGAWALQANVAVRDPSVRVLPSGEAWLGGRGTHGTAELWRSPAPGSWARVAYPEPLTPVRVASAGPVVFASTFGELAQRVNGEWVWHGRPPVGDSLVDTRDVAAAGEQDVYVGGQVHRGAFGNGAAQPYLARWTGSAWQRVAMPAGLTLDVYNVVRFLATADAGGAPVYGVVYTSGNNPARYHLVSITGGVATYVPDPVTAAGRGVVGLAAGPDGAPFVVAVDRVAWMQGGAWQEHVLRDGWSAIGGIFVAPSGTVYLGAQRQGATGQQEFAVLELERL